MANDGNFFVVVRRKIVCNFNDTADADISSHQDMLYKNRYSTKSCSTLRLFYLLSKSLIKIVKKFVFKKVTEPQSANLPKT